jgi:hypothetical protein
MTYRRALFPHLLFFLLSVLAGCSDPAGGRVVISGHVTLEGKALDKGSILFVPLDGQDTQSGAAITDGDYVMPRDHGLKPGKYLVRITAGDGKTPANEEAGQPGGSTNIISMDRIPEDWNTQSKQQCEVKPNEPNKFDFDIPKANTPRRH